MNDELVMRLRDAAKMSEALAVLLPHSEGNATAKLYNEAANAIEELSGYVQEAERDRDEYKERFDKTNDLMQKQWIPVTERLPEDDTAVLANVYWPKYGDTMVCYGHWHKGWCHLFHHIEGELISGYVVTHWMPLPEPPKEEQA